MSMDYSQALASLAAAHEEVVVMTAENRAPIRDLPALLGERFLDVGICEQTLVGAAAGLALRGRIPVVHGLAAFLVMRAFEFVRTDVGVGRLPVKLVGYIPGFLSEANGPTHQALEDIALMRGIPGMQVFCPADEDELVEALPFLVLSPAPCYIRYNPTKARASHAAFAVGQAEVISEGGDVAILTHGLLVAEALEAADRLLSSGISTSVVNLRMLKPIDEDAIAKVARDARLVVALEDHFATGGLRTTVSEILLRRGLSRFVLGVDLEERYFRPALLQDVLDHEGFSGPRVAERVLRALHTLKKAKTMANRVRFNESYPDIARSDALYERALGLIPAATQTLAKGPEQFVRGVAPKYLWRGKGAHVWDVDANEYIDYSMGVGPISLGYQYEKVDRAIREQLQEGITFSLMHPLEVEVAELVRELVPNAESVRFSKTGAEVTSAAVRLARAHTGRTNVLCCGYHGWHDWYIGVTDRNRGVPHPVRDMTFTFDYNDLCSVLDSLDQDTACVILEPVTFEPPRDGFLEELKRACVKNGTLLIFDEMWTGFRLALGGAQEYFGTTADLACFSKAVANGMPLSLLTGRREIMSLLEKDVFFFSTFGGEALSLAAARATLLEMREQRVPQHLARQGRKLRDGYNAEASALGLDYTRCVGLDCRTMVTFDPKAGNPLDLKSFLQQELLKRGILWGGFHNVSFSHTDEDIDYTLAAYREVLALLRAAVSRGSVRESLRGEPVAPVFRRTGHFNVRPRPKVAPL